MLIKLHGVDFESLTPVIRKKGNCFFVNPQSISLIRDGYEDGNCWMNCSAIHISNGQNQNIKVYCFESVPEVMEKIAESEKGRQL